MKFNSKQLRKLLEQHFDFIPERSTDDELVIVCPEPGCPDKTGNRTISASKGITNCWRCNKSYSVRSLLAKRGIDTLDPDDNASLAGVTNPVQEMLSQRDVKKVEIKQVHLPAGFKYLSSSSNKAYIKFISRMAERKKLTLDDLIAVGVGYTTVGSWEPYAIFPVFEFGSLVYYQGRTYSQAKEGGPTKKFPSKRECPLGASYWIYNYDMAMQTGVTQVIIVESILNVISLTKELLVNGVTDTVPVAVFKHAISKPQLAKLAALPASEICIMFDGDATVDAWRTCRKINKQVSVAEMPVGVDANDDCKLAYERWIARKKYSIANELMSML